MLRAALYATTKLGKAAPSGRTAAPLPGRSFHLGDIDVAPTAIAEAIAVAIAEAVAYFIPGLRTRL